MGLLLLFVIIISVLSMDGKLKKVNQQNEEIIDLLRRLNNKSQ